jgi:hypothetical protein
VILARFAKGMGKKTFIPPCGLTFTGWARIVCRSFHPLQQKSASGAATEGCSWPSQWMRMTRERPKRLSKVNHA